MSQMYRIKASAEKKKRLMEAYRDLYDQILNIDAQSEDSLYQVSQFQNSQPDKVPYGNYRRMFARDFCRKIEAKFGKDGKKLAELDVKVCCCGSFPKQKLCN